MASVEARVAGLEHQVIEVWGHLQNVIALQLICDSLVVDMRKVKNSLACPGHSELASNPGRPPLTPNPRRPPLTPIPPIPGEQPSALRLLALPEQSTKSVPKTPVADAKNDGKVHIPSSSPSLSLSAQKNMSILNVEIEQIRKSIAKLEQLDISTAVTELTAKVMKMELQLQSAPADRRHFNEQQSVPVIPPVAIMNQDPLSDEVLRPVRSDASDVLSTSPIFSMSPPVAKALPHGEPISEKLSDLQEMVSRLGSMLGALAHEQKDIKQILDEVEGKQDGFRSVLESLSLLDCIDTTKREIVRDVPSTGKPTQSGAAETRVGQACHGHSHSMDTNAEPHDPSFEYRQEDNEKGNDLEKIPSLVDGRQFAATTTFPPRGSQGPSRNLRKGKRASWNVQNSIESVTCFRECLQLNRKRLTERCMLEGRLLSNMFTICNFIIMVVFFLGVQIANYPVDFVNEIHEGLRNKFHVDDKFFGPGGCHSPSDIMEYTQRFINQSYEMSSALIDATTFDHIEMDRCRSDTVNDICRLKYWKFPQNSNKLNYFNDTLFDLDQLTQNNAPSVMDCSAPAPEINCINRSDPKFLSPQPGNSRTFGLTPEDPIILDTKMDYPHASVVPLTPLVWQTRASRVPCDGFGDQYNNDILGAGGCHADITCDPDKVTEFSNAKKNLQTNRRQSIFVSYVEPAFACVDRRSGKQAKSFKDKSWAPWATFQDLTQGTEANKAIVQGQEVYWKFVSDVAYLQAPFEVYLRDDMPQSCKASNVICAKSSSRCKDPLEDPGHPMWGESNVTRFYCSFHEHYATSFLSLPPRSRKNTFLTIETNQFTMAVLVITPFSADFPDIATVLMVTFRISQSGSISFSSNVASVSTTPPVWYKYWILDMCCATAFFLHACKGAYKSFRMWWYGCDESSSQEGWAIFDFVLSLAVMGHGLAALVIDLTPPHVVEELIDSLQKDSPQAYFDFFVTLMDYQETTNQIQDYGFFIALFLFLRLNIFMSLHPRLESLARTLTGAADDMFHLLLYVLLLMVFLAYLGWWSFGHNADAFRDIARTFYRLLRMIAGDALFEDSDKPPGLKQLCYLIIYIFLVFFILFNFFLAIVVNMYTAVQTYELQSNVVDNSLLADLFDLIKTRILLWRGRVVDPRDLVSYLKNEGRGLVETSAVTAEELLEIRVNGKVLFASFEQAESCIRTYARKVIENGDTWILEETDAKNRFPSGRYFNHRDPASWRPGLLQELSGEGD